MILYAHCILLIMTCLSFVASILLYPVSVSSTINLQGRITMKPVKVLAQPLDLLSSSTGILSPQPLLDHLHHDHDSDDDDDDDDDEEDVDDSHNHQQQKQRQQKYEIHLRYKTCKVQQLHFDLSGCFKGQVGERSADQGQMCFVGRWMKMVEISRETKNSIQIALMAYQRLKEDQISMQLQGPDTETKQTRGVLHPELCPGIKLEVAIALPSRKWLKNQRLTRKNVKHGGY